jgi:dolichyl-phosphate beta-glucosyltransferase
MIPTQTCIIIPCYNEAKRIDLATFQKFIQKEEHIHFLFVDDGSSDNTSNILADFCNKNSSKNQLHTLLKNSGKAEAVRQGVLLASQNKMYKYIGYWDADLATPLEEISHFLDYTNGHYKLIIGCRISRLGAKVKRKSSRHYIGRVFATFASIILKINVYDTQCGAKIFHRDYCSLFTEPFITKWLFDV